MLGELEGAPLRSSFPDADKLSPFTSTISSPSSDVAAEAGFEVQPAVRSSVYYARILL